MKKIIFFLFLMLFMTSVSAVIAEERILIPTGNTAEISFNTSQKVINYGWIHESDLPEVYRDTFRGYPLRMWRNNNKFEIELDAPDCQEGLGEPCKYSSLFNLSDSDNANGILMSNFNVPYYTAVSGLSGATSLIAPYISVMSGSLELFQLNLTELGFISDNPDLGWCGEYVTALPEGEWYIIGIELGKEWVSFYGVAKTTMFKIAGISNYILQGTANNANNGTIFRVYKNNWSQTKIWVQCEKNTVVVWKNVRDGSDSGFFYMLLRKN